LPKNPKNKNKITSMNPRLKAGVGLVRPLGERGQT